MFSIVLEISIYDMANSLKIFILFHSMKAPKTDRFSTRMQDVAQAISTLGTGEMRDIGGCGGDCPDPISAGWARYLLVPNDLPCPVACASNDELIARASKKQREV
jgi:hypothetical protein